MAASDKELKVVILGAERTGKTALVNKYIHSTFTQGHHDSRINTTVATTTTTGDDSKRITVDGQDYLLRLLQANSQADTNTNNTTNTLYQTGEAFILLYAIDNRTSFQNIKQLHNQLRQSRSSTLLSTPVFLVGTKADLEDQRQVSLQEARHLAIALHCQKLFEVSSKLHTDEINDMFNKLVSERSRLDQGYLTSTSRPPMTPVQTAPEPVITSPQPTITTMRTTTSVNTANGIDDSPKRNGGGGNVLERLKLGSLRRRSSIQSLVRKKSGSFGESIMSLGSAKPSRDNVSRNTPYGSNGANGNTGYYTLNGRSSASTTRTNGSSLGSPYRLDIDTSAWRETIKWPSEIIPEEDMRIK